MKEEKGKKMRALTRGINRYPSYMFLSVITVNILYMIIKSTWRIIKWIVKGLIKLTFSILETTSK